MSAITYISLNPPYEIADDAEAFTFSGWAEVDDEAHPNVRLWLNGVEVPVETWDRPGVKRHIPAIAAARGLTAQVDFRQVLGGLAQVPEPFLLEATVGSDHRRRTFEYAVGEAWLQNIFGVPLRPRRTPPPALQIRVTGAAAGEYHATGRRVAEQIADLLDGVGRPIAGFRHILDFGCGPGRVIGAVRDLNPTARLSGSDIDPEAIAWAADKLADVGDFHVNGAAPPLPFADGAFDLVYAISVFTHLPQDMERLWLAELRRILAPGGVLLTTKLDPAAYDLPAEVKAGALDSGFAYWGEAAATDGLPDFYRLAYHTDDYVRRVWGAYFDVLHLGSHDLNNTQDAVVMAKPAAG